MFFPMRTQFANISALVPQTASSDYNQKGVSAGISDLHSFKLGRVAEDCFPLHTV